MIKLKLFLVILHIMLVNFGMKGSSEFALWQIGVVGCGDHLCGIRCHKTQTSAEATTS